MNPDLSRVGVVELGALNSQQEFKRWLHVWSGKQPKGMAYPWPFADGPVDWELLQAHMVLGDFRNWPKSWDDFTRDLMYVIGIPGRSMRQPYVCEGELKLFAGLFPVPGSHILPVLTAGEASKRKYAIPTEFLNALVGHYEGRRRAV